MSDTTTVPVRVRYAPSPTGPLHLGGVRTALYNYCYARKNGGAFIIRVEDTDQNRFVPGAEEYILEALAWSGMTHDEGPDVGGPYAPYRQSERKHLYRQYADQLVKEGHAYYAFDTPEELEDMRKQMEAGGTPNAQYNAISRQYMKNSLVLPADEVTLRLDKGEPYVIRIKMPRNEEIRLHDEIRGWVVFHTSQLDDKVLFKSDGMPTYHLANVVDDYLMRISHVIRGEEWLPSAPLHVYLYRCLGWEAVMPKFAHLPLVLKPDGNGKLSKRDGDRLGFPVFPLNWTDPATGEKSMGFRERGFFPEPFNNMIALLGWHPSNNEEVFTLPKLIEAFSIEKVSKAGAKFDFEKGKWFNQQYIKNMNGVDLAIAVKVLFPSKVFDNDTYLAAVCNAVKERLTFLSEFWDNAYYFFEDTFPYDTDIISKKWNNAVKSHFATLRNELTALEPFNADTLNTFLHEFPGKQGIKAGDVLPVLRIMLSGTKNGPGINEIAHVLGKEKTLARIDKAINTWKHP